MSTIDPNVALNTCAAFLIAAAKTTTCDETRGKLTDAALLLLEDD